MDLQRFRLAVLTAIVAIIVSFVVGFLTGYLAMRSDENSKEKELNYRASNLVNLLKSSNIENATR